MSERYFRNGGKDFGRRYQRFIVGDMKDSVLYSNLTNEKKNPMFGKWWHQNMIGNSFKQVSAIFNEYDIWKQYTEYRMNLNDRTAIYAPRIKTHMNYNINACGEQY